MCIIQNGSQKKFLVSLSEKINKRHTYLASFFSEIEVSNILI